MIIVDKKKSGLELNIYVRVPDGERLICGLEK
jgi:hypothetical protein